MKRIARTLRSAGVVVAVAALLTAALPGTAFASITTVTGPCVDTDIRVFSEQYLVGHCYRGGPGEIWPGINDLDEVFFGSRSGDMTICIPDHTFCYLEFFNPGDKPMNWNFGGTWELHRLKVY